ncbi:type II toxin-antitoxin system VapC family toxin [Sphingomonas koreensis]|nr:type II toxin-antitoxin system VapC family toxin [Sphingomonas koreensis]
MTDPAYLLDTNVCIYILEGRISALRTRLERQSPGAIVVSAISFAEVMRGVARDDHDRERRAERLFGFFPVLPFDVSAASAYRDVPFKRGSFDRLIAAHALALGLALVTNNERDFADVPKLKVENWTLPL